MKHALTARSRQYTLIAQSTLPLIDGLHLGKTAGRLWIYWIAGELECDMLLTYNPQCLVILHPSPSTSHTQQLADTTCDTTHSSQSAAQLPFSSPPTIKLDNSPTKICSPFSMAPPIISYSAVAKGAKVPAPPPQAEEDSATKNPPFAWRPAPLSPQKGEQALPAPNSSCYFVFPLLGDGADADIGGLLLPQSSPLTPTCSWTAVARGRDSEFDCCPKGSNAPRRFSSSMLRWTQPGLMLTTRFAIAAPPQFRPRVYFADAPNEGDNTNDTLSPSPASPPTKSSVADEKEEETPALPTIETMSATPRPSSPAPSLTPSEAGEIEEKTA